MVNAIFFVGLACVKINKKRSDVKENERGNTMLLNRKKNLKKDRRKTTENVQAHRPARFDLKPSQDQSTDTLLKSKHHAAINNMYVIEERKRGTTWKESFSA